MKTIFYIALFCLLQCFFSSAQVQPITHATTPLSFLSLGDWGSVNSNQSEVAEYLGNAAAQLNAQFLLAVGDNFYENGVTNDTDPQWKSTYEDVFTHPALNIPWYAIAGNHDHHYGRGQGEIDFYLNKRDSRWYYPSWWYNEVITLDDTKQTLQFVFIDTIILTCVDILNKNSNIYDEAVGDSCTQYPAKEHLMWVEEVLANSTADWLIVVGHYPVFSGGEHGNTQWMIDNILPLLQKYNVDIYLCGHDHTLQHLQNTENPLQSTQFFLSGNGAKYGEFHPTPQSKFGIVDPGFMTHTLTKNTIVTTMIDHHGKQLYTFAQQRLVKSWEMNNNVPETVQF
jgi:tartrate-resistant acid phosphatase type 5